MQGLSGDYVQVSVTDTGVGMPAEVLDQVLEARDGHEAMALLAGPLRYDLLLSDVDLPGPNGRQVADFARERLPGLPVILMTGYVEEAVMRGTFLGEARDLLVKPFGADALSAKVTAALRWPV